MSPGFEKLFLTLSCPPPVSCFSILDMPNPKNVPQFYTAMDKAIEQSRTVLTLVKDLMNRDKELFVGSNLTICSSVIKPYPFGFSKTLTFP